MYIQKSSTKYLQTKFNNTVLGSYTMIKCNLSQECKYSLKFAYQCDTSHYKMKTENHMIISVSLEKSLDKM